MNNKDWTGNKRSTFATLGASNHSKHQRQEHDYYATDPVTIQPLLDQLKKDGVMLGHIWENASGGGASIRNINGKRFWCFRNRFNTTK